jgi:hypothetical protein
VSRRSIFWLVVVLAGTVLLAVVGAIVFSLLDKNGALGLVSDLEDETARDSGRDLYRRFLLFSAIGGIGWAIYTCLLSYWISTALADFALASIVISGLVTTVRLGLDRGIPRSASRSEPGSGATCVLAALAAESTPK